MLRITHILFSLSFFGMIQTALAQGSCQIIQANKLCADSPPPTVTLMDQPFNAACITNSNQHFFFTFKTNSIGGLPASISIVPSDCNDFLGDNDITVLVTPIASGSDPCNPANYLDPQCFTDSGPFTFQVNNLLPSTDYIVLVSSDHSSVYGPCTFSIDLEGDAVDLVAGADPVLITLGESSNLSVQGADTGTSVSWSNAQFLDNAASANPVATPEATITFQVSGTVNGCMLTDLVTVTIGPPITIYNTFTPNDDGTNDFWVIKGIERFPSAQVQIFDRWGQSIFKSVGYPKPWDGTFKGNRLPTAAYYYVIELNSLEVNIPPITGIVSIVH